MHKIKFDLQQFEILQLRFINEILLRFY